MQRPILLLLATLFSFIPLAQSQTLVKQGEGEQQIQLIPGQTLSLEVVNSGVPVSFATGFDYGETKVIPAYYRIVVSAPPVPWVVTATVQDVSSVDANVNILEDVARLVSLRCVGTNNKVRLSAAAPQVVVLGNTMTERSQYALDVIFDPPFNMPAGRYMMNINFQLQLQ